MKAMLYDHRYKNRKDFFLCDFDMIKIAVQVCQRGIITCEKGKQKKGSKTKQKGGSKTTQKRRPNIIEKELAKANYMIDKYNNKISKINDKL